MSIGIIFRFLPGCGRLDGSLVLGAIWLWERSDRRDREGVLERLGPFAVSSPFSAFFADPGAHNLEANREEKPTPGL